MNIDGVFFGFLQQNGSYQTPDKLPVYENNHKGQNLVLAAVFVARLALIEHKGEPMNTSPIKIRLMTVNDFDAVVEIDDKILQASRLEYYEMKFDKLFKSKEFLPTSLVAEIEDGKVVGFVMAELYMGEYGISQDGATLDTIGVDPDYRHQGIGELLISEIFDHLRNLGVKKINTLVDKNDSRLIQFFMANKFNPSKNIINLERIL